MIDIESLSVTQNGFRDPGQITEMVRFVALGEVFHVGWLHDYSSGNSVQPISIVRFENGRHFIHDGHHRVAAVYLGGRKALLDSEYILTKWKYQQYAAANLDKGWVTPFDPRFETRKADLHAFKACVEYRRKTSDEHAMSLIRSCRAEYCQPRIVLTIQDLVRSLHLPPAED